MSKQTDAAAEKKEQAADRQDAREQAAVEKRDQTVVLADEKDVKTYGPVVIGEGDESRVRGIIHEIAQLTDDGSLRAVLQAVHQRHHAVHLLKDSYAADHAEFLAKAELKSTPAAVAVTIVEPATLAHVGVQQEKFRKGHGPKDAA